MNIPISPESPWLAPLAGFSDLPFRLLCREQGAAVCCTEMVSAKGLVYGGKNTEELLETCPEDSPLVVQIFGAEAPFMEQAIQQLLCRGFTFFDVNMGCSVPKVNKTGSGSAMLKDIDNALLVAEKIVDAAGPGRAGFKLRLGWDSGHEVYEDFALALEQLGAGWISLHPRTARQGFSGEARHGVFAPLATRLRIPLMASGDLFTAKQGVECLRNCGVSGLMYARGALNNPAIFKDHQTLMQGRIPVAQSPQELMALIQRHAELARTYAPKSALLKMRTFVPRYVRHLNGAKALRQELLLCRTWDALDQTLAKGLALLSPTTETDLSLNGNTYE